MGKKLTLQQYNTLKAIHSNNPQGVSLDEFVKAACALKELEYDPAIHEPAPPKVPLEQHISRSKAGLGDNSKDTHKHELKRVETPADNGRKIILLTCKCGYKEAIDLI